MYYLWVFLIGGFVCMLGQVLIIYTNITSARILVTFVIIGVVLEAFGILTQYQNLQERVLMFRL